MIREVVDGTLELLDSPATPPEGQAIVDRGEAETEDGEEDDRRRS
jgi:hypothetical protein